MLEDFASAARKVVAVGLIFATVASLSACSTIPTAGGSHIVHRDFSNKKAPCLSEYNTRTARLKVSITCTGPQVSAAKAFYNVKGVQIIREHKGSRFLGTHRRVPVVPADSEKHVPDSEPVHTHVPRSHSEEHEHSADSEKPVHIPSPTGPSKPVETKPSKAYGGHNHPHKHDDLVTGETYTHKHPHPKKLPHVHLEPLKLEPLKPLRP